MKERPMKLGKRAIDLVIAGVLLIVLSPVFLVVAASIRLTMGSPVLFRQVRPGLHGRPFTMLKFRTMTDARDASGRHLPDSQRLTRLGRWLRATSLDEFPELVNVLKGDMSLVGPRPLLMRYMPYFTDRERIRFAVRPGITGLAQVSGRNALPWDERLELDVRYVEEWSLGLDFRILWMTVRNVLRRSGVEVDPTQVMLDFDEERRLKKQVEGVHRG